MHSILEGGDYQCSDMMLRFFLCLLTGLLNIQSKVDVESQQNVLLYFELIVKANLEGREEN